MILYDILLLKRDWRISWFENIFENLVNSIRVVVSWRMGQMQSEAILLYSYCYYLVKCEKGLVSIPMFFCGFIAVHSVDDFVLLLVLCGC